MCSDPSDVQAVTFEVRKRNQVRLSMNMLPNNRQQLPKWVHAIRRKRRGPWKYLDTPWHRKVAPVMHRKTKPIKIDVRKAL